MATEVKLLVGFTWKEVQSKEPTAGHHSGKYTTNEQKVNEKDIAY